ncbi:MAG: sugar-binding domain-containing protein [Actinomyces urogenitalis]|uniref:sugar-binding transcriptional regulator n=1 Tax=Actinomyces urogenitalis TaxID=103621 RepID=UPI002432F920|nr:sugar-binding domain-containing protein [Actinomyces urogenitalis]MCI7457691.1 helix-turn-helix domain-containing protein [Actinomyces urogenitalis]MDY3678502.1 sugar-binding domain-containing protein [Actinomyces urogenitalis]
MTSAPRSRPARKAGTARSEPVGEARGQAEGDDVAAPSALSGSPDALVTYEAASMYYAQGETMEVIARHLGVSRSTVSRLLARARAQGIVRIEVVQPGGAGSLERALHDELGVRTQIVPVREGTTEIHRLQQVAAVGAARMLDLVTELSPLPALAGADQAAGGAGAVGDAGATGGAGAGAAGLPVGEAGLVVGVAWGTTMSEVAAALPVRQVPGLTVVQLNGASDPLREGPSAAEVLTRMGQVLGARTISFPVPAFFDQVATRQAMWSERSVKRVLAVARSARLAVFSVGSLGADVPSQVYAGGHLSRADMTVLRREEVVGDVCTVLLRADGTWGDIDLNARATGPTPVQLSRIPRRLCIVAGTGKARATLAALRARVATDLVIDDATARAVLALAHRKETL